MFEIYNVFRGVMSLCVQSGALRSIDVPIFYIYFSSRSELYNQLTRNFGRAFPSKTKLKIQSEVNSLWNSLKKSKDFESKVLAKISEYKEKATQHGLSLKKFWVNIPKPRTFTSADDTNINSDLKSCDEVPIDIEKCPLNEKDNSNTVDVRLCDDVTISDSASDNINIGTLRHFEKPAQKSIRDSLEILNGDMVGLYKRKSAGLLSSEQEKELKDKEKQKVKLTKKLKKKSVKKSVREKIVRSAFGRPRIEETQPLLLQTITDIAVYGSAAHEKRQSVIYRSVKTLDELCTAINARDEFQISRSGLYLRLIPKRSKSIEGKRHVHICPVKLFKAQNDKHCKHPDGRFCTSTVNALEELASFLGPKQVCLISQDDKARVSIGLTAAKLQAPLLMHVEYRVSLPDHDWVVASQHKLIPSVYAGIDIKENGFGKPEAVGYSGPTYIAIRSGNLIYFCSSKVTQVKTYPKLKSNSKLNFFLGKHSSSTAFSHCLDIERLIEMP